MLRIAEVKDTSIAFKPVNDDNGDELPLGTIRIQIQGNGIKERSLYTYASPYSSIRRIPLIGEHVLVFQAPSYFSLGGGNNDLIYYYLDPISIQGTVNYNILPKTNVTYTPSTNSYTKAISPSVTTGNSKFKPGDNFKEQNVKSLQPYEGEVLIEGRSGNSIRFGNTYTSYGSNYQVAPTYKTSVDQSPILILRNGVDTSNAGKTYVVENIEKDKSSVYLTSNQTLTGFKGAQPKVGVGVKLLSQYKDPQVALAADRIVLNAKRDNIILVSKTDVVVATPRWQMQLDKLFTILEQYIDQVNKILSGQQPLPTGVGPTGPAPNLAQLQKALSDLKTMKQ